MKMIELNLIPITNYFIFVVTVRHENHSDALKQIFSKCWNHAILNVLVLIQIPNDSLLLSTYLPYKNHCKVLTRYDLEIFTKTKLKSGTSFGNLFPAKLKNFNGCPMYVGTNQNPPFSIISNGQVTGINANILKLIASHYNFSIIYNILHNSVDPTYLYMNGSAGGLFELVSLLIFKSINK